MIKGLSAASIWSADLNNLLPFYRDVLGLKVVIQSPRFVVLGEAGGPSIGLGTHSDVRGRNADPARHMLGLTTGKAPKFVKRYANLAEEIANAAQRFAKEVASGEFPGPEHEYSANGSAPAPAGEKEEVRYGAG